MAITVNSLGFGTASLTSMPFARSAINVLDCAYDTGIRHFDTAAIYGKGYAEVLVGDFLRSKKREDLTIATKFGLGLYQNHSLPAAIAMPLNYIKKKIKPEKRVSAGKKTPSKFADRLIDATEVRNNFETSMKRLKCAYLDYFFLHEGLPFFLTDEAMTYLKKLKQNGDVRFTGLAANAFNLHTIQQLDLAAWDILQYEQNDILQDNSLIKKYPSTSHFLHSCLQAFSHNEPSPLGIDAGKTLYDSSQYKGVEKVIFATRRKAILKQNVGQFLNAGQTN